MKRDGLHLVGGHYNGERHTNRLKVLLATADFVRLTGSQFQEVLCPFGFADKVERLSVVFHNGPVRIVLAYWSVNFEPTREFHEQFDVVTLVQFLRELSLNL
jgi:hypothetical protein